MELNVKWNEEIRNNESYLRKAWAQENIRKVVNYLNDTDRKERKQQQLCKYCKYMGSGWGLNAITEANCGRCGQVRTFGSSNVDVLCEECAKETKSCKHCGGKMD
jgi:hypothetical protein